MKNRKLALSIVLATGLGMAAHADIRPANTVAVSGAHSSPSSGSDPIHTIDGSGLYEPLTDANLATVTHDNGFDGSILYLAQGTTDQPYDVVLEYKWILSVTNQLTNIALWNFSQSGQTNRSATSVDVSVDTGTGYVSLGNFILTQNDGETDVESDLLDVSAFNLTDVVGVKVALQQDKLDSYDAYTTGLSEAAFQFSGTIDPAPPVWDDPIVVSIATAGIAYSDTLAGKATDPDGDDESITYSLGDTIAETWLTVAPTGELGGIPVSSGTNDFNVVAIDADGSTTGLVQIVVKSLAPPVWDDPIVVPPATVNVGYSSTLAGQATDPDGDDESIIYSLGDTISETWLTVASTGELGGTPVSLGTSDFNVVATDADGSSTGLVQILVKDVVPTGLLLYFNGEDTSSPLVDQVGGLLGEAAGDPGHLYGLPSAVGFGSAMGLTTNAAWTLSDSSELNGLLNDFSVAAWVYLDSAIMATKTGSNAKGNRIIGDDEAWNGDAWAFGYDSSNQQLLFTKNGVADAFDPTAGSLGLDGWHHVAATVSSTDGISFYVDGVLSGVNGNTANLVNTGSDVFSVGRSSGSGEAQWFAGKLDEIRVYNGVLSLAEIQALMVPTLADIGTITIAGPIAITGGQGMTISWSNTGNGQSYEVQAKYNLVIDDWTTITTATGNGGGITVTTAVDQAETFYQVITP